ncbi:unnamed protein product [marine sediment metagenome]|uniref:Uncharacterized protein n=1 Tax=marine sediment metagenome TaxID=412755 RepID=X0VKU2_9ZZZZ
MEVLAAAAKADIAAIIGRIGAAELLLEAADWFSGELKDLQGPDDSAQVVGVDSLG